MTQQKPATKYYAVRQGRNPGIYTDYYEAQVQTHRYPHSEYRCFSNYDDALNYLHPKDDNDTEFEAEIRIQFDGGSRGNPGKAGSGVVVMNNRQQRWEGYKYLGDMKTNNEAEYEGLIMGLQYVIHHGLGDKAIMIQGDSKLVINQLSGEWTCHSTNLIEKYNRAKALLQQCDKVTLSWIPRDKNQHADKLSNDAMNEEKTNVDITLELK